MDERRVAIAVDLTIKLENNPGTIANIGEALGKAGINIHGMCGVPFGAGGIIHVLVDDPVAANEALSAAGIVVEHERSVLVVPMQDTPGAFGKITRKLANAGVNIDLTYLATGDRLVLGVDNLRKASALF